MAEPAAVLLHELLLSAAERGGSDLAVSSDGSGLTYAELVDAAARLASALTDAGVRPGDRVAIAMANDRTVVVAVFATLFAGGAFVLINPEATRDTLDAVLARSGAKVLIEDATRSTAVGDVRRRIPTVRAVIAEGSGGAEGTIDLATAIAEATPITAARRMTSSDLAALVFTSGTSGEPKGVMMTHENLVFLAGSISGYLGIAPSDRILSALSLAHTYGLSWLLASVRTGASLFLERSFAYPAKLQQRISDDAVTVFPGVPTVFAILLSLHTRTPLSLPSVTKVTCAGGALLPSFHDGMRQVFPNADIFHMYGQTECMRASYLEPGLLSQRPTSCGKAIPGTEAMVLSSDGTPVAPGEIGTLHVRGPHVTPGYFREPELTAGIIRDGPDTNDRSLCTHDLFTVDDEGFLYFVGRSDEIIKSRGEKVTPVEIENALHAIDGVREAAVVGVPDDLLGEAVRAYVVLEEWVTLTEADIIRACRGALESYKVPKEVIVLEEMPKTPTGKIMKRRLVPQRP